MNKEINKFLKKISAEKLKGNNKECIELYNIVGGLYSEISSYDEAIHYHEKALDLCRIMGDRLGTAVAHRYIGEAKASAGSFNQAIEHIKKYLDLSQRACDKVETQRAWTTLGRVYLMQAQELRDKSNIVDEQTKETAREAEKKFQRALSLAESVRDQVDEKEYAQMTSGLLINLALIKDICGQHADSVQKLNRASEICKAAKLKEDLHRCQIVLAGIFRQKGNVKMAVRSSEEALATAKSIGRKLLICDSLIEQGLVRILQRDFKNAKRSFAQAYLEKSPSEEDHAKAIRLTKLAHLIADSYERFSKDETASETRLKLCDKLGDLFVAVDFYKLAIEFYRRAFADARICQKPKSERARLLSSLGETYADDGQLDNALLCYEKELALRADNPPEQCQSLIRIAQISEQLQKDSKKVIEVYERALDLAAHDPKMMYIVLKEYVPYMDRKLLNPNNRRQELENTLMSLSSFPEVAEEIEGEDQEEANDLEDEVPNVDDIITDDDDDDEIMVIGRRKSRAGATKFKPNEVGDTPLHEACIKGDMKRVKSLIAQGHEINPRDNAGWIPLHEACNHGHSEIVEYLIDKGADVNHRGLKGMTPLHDAATNGHYAIIRTLMRNGANVIALTDTGETVLSCLRDYKKRNYSEMSNGELSEYNQVEAELLNTMDKCGYNLMEENIKSLGRANDRNNCASRGTRPGTSGPTIQHHQPQPSTSGFARSTRDHLRPQAPLQHPREAQEAPMRHNNVRNPSSDDHMSPCEGNGTNHDAVRDYRVVIGTLKRKRNPNDELGARQKSRASSSAEQPATYSTGMNPSAPTKEWLIDDVSKTRRLIDRRSILMRTPSPEVIDEIEDEFDESDDNHRADDGTNKRNSNTVSVDLLSDNDDDDVVEVEPVPQRQQQHGNDSPDDASDLFEPHQFPQDNDFGEDEYTTTSFTQAAGRSSSCNNSNSNNHNDSGSGKAFNLFEQPLKVSIDNRKLLVPVKDKRATVRWLRETIEERYAVAAGARPNVVLLIGGDAADYSLFDADICKDVIKKDNIKARIESWRLKSIEQQYLDECAAQSIEPLSVIKVELRKLDQRMQTGTGVSGSQQLDVLDWSWTRFARSHVKPVVAALARRQVNDCNLSGAACFFEHTGDAHRLLRTVCTWQRLCSLNLSCCGLRQQEFEILCGGRNESESNTMSELHTLDVSYNIIIYKKAERFVEAINRMKLRTCPKLQRLNVRKNLLQFVGALAVEEQRSVDSDGGDNDNRDIAKALRQYSVSAANCTAAGETGQAGEADTCRWGDLQILGSDQNYFTLYCID